MKAEDVVARTREQLSAVEAAIRNHPYLAAVRAGEVPLEAIKALPGHQHHMAISDMRSIATMVARFGDTPHVDFFNGILQGQLGEREKILVLTRKLGMTEAELDAYLSRTGLTEMPTADREGLTRLHRAHLHSIPFRYNPTT